MRHLIIIFLLLISKLNFSQSFISGNIYVNSNGCQYQLDGQYFDSTSTGVINFNFDSVLLAYKYILPIGFDSASVCLYSTNCSCDTSCLTIYNGQNLIRYLNICLTTNLDNLSLNTSIYPNPFRDFLVINSQGGVSILIIDQTGKLVFSGESLDILEINTEYLSTGLYNIVVLSRYSRRTFRIIKE